MPPGGKLELVEITARPDFSKLEDPADPRNLLGSFCPSKVAGFANLFKNNATQTAHPAPFF